MSKGIDPKDIKEFQITGLYARSSKRFKKITTSDFRYAMSINLWSGSVWAVLHSGKRKLIKRV